MPAEWENAGQMTDVWSRVFQPSSATMPLNAPPARARYNFIQIGLPPRPRCNTPENLLRTRTKVEVFGEEGLRRVGKRDECVWRVSRLVWAWSAARKIAGHRLRTEVKPGSKHLLEGRIISFALNSLLTTFTFSQAFHPFHLHTCVYIFEKVADQRECNYIMFVSVCAKMYRRIDWSVASRFDSKNKRNFLEERHRGRLIFFIPFRITRVF